MNPHIPLSYLVARLPAPTSGEEPQDGHDDDDPQDRMHDQAQDSRDNDDYYGDKDVG
jgi:hypothetical protein